MKKLIRPLACFILVVSILLMFTFPVLAYKVYRVHPGDNIQKIAVWYGVSSEWLIKVNHLDNPGYLVPGEALLIPEPSVKEDERVYAVKPGDTLRKIAQKYEVSLDWLFERNNLNWNSRIYTGQMIRIPAPPPIFTPPQPGGPKPKQTYVYNIPGLMARYPGYIFLKAAATEKKVALTFDDGPDTRFTPLILIRWAGWA
jgi:LysM repeat protein